MILSIDSLLATYAFTHDPFLLMWAVAHNEKGIYDSRFRNDMTKLAELGFVISEKGKFRSTQKSKIALDHVMLSSSDEKIFDPQLVNGFLSKRWHMLWLGGVNTKEGEFLSLADYTSTHKIIAKHEVFEVMKNMGWCFSFLFIPILAGLAASIDHILSFALYVVLILPWMFWAGIIFRKYRESEN